MPARTRKRRLSSRLEQPAVEQPTEEDRSLVERTIDTPYYTVVVPESWRGVLAYDYDDAYTIDEQSKGTDTELGVGYTTTVRNTRRMRCSA